MFIGSTSHESENLSKKESKKQDYKDRRVYLLHSNILYLRRRRKDGQTTKQEKRVGEQKEAKKRKGQTTPIYGINTHDKSIYMILIFLSVATFSTISLVITIVSFTFWVSADWP